MKAIILVLLSCFLTIPLAAQFGPQRIVSNNTQKAYLSMPFDINNDGFMDIVTASLQTFDLRWHQNLDGQGNFSEEIFISNGIAYLLFIDFVDIDSDGDKDLLYLGNNPRVIGWFENLDGLGNFSVSQTIMQSQVDFISSVSIIDLDLDGDLDIITKRTNTFADRIVWYENLDGMANFGDEILLIDLIQEVYPPIMVDIDSDGLVDILTAHENVGPARLVWYKNLGDETFDDEAEIYQFNYVASDFTSIHWMQYVDVNADMKYDIIITAHNDDTGTFYYWLENIDNQGNFSDIQPLPAHGRFYDLDNDGDNDMLAGNRLVDRIYWIENVDGQGNYDQESTISTAVDFLRDIRAADFNGDGQLDVVSASLGDNKVAWYEYGGIFGVDENKANLVTIYPNPVTNVINIQSAAPIAQLSLLNSLGQIIPCERIDNAINISTIAAGIYYLKIEGTNGAFETFRVIKK